MVEIYGLNLELEVEHEEVHSVEEVQVSRIGKVEARSGKIGASLSVAIDNPPPPPLSLPNTLPDRLAPPRVRSSAHDVT